MRQIGFAVSNGTAYHSLLNTSRITMCVLQANTIPALRGRACFHSPLAAAEAKSKEYARRMGPGVRLGVCNEIYQYKSTVIYLILIN